MAISVGDRLPDTTFKVLTDDGLADMTTQDVFAGKTVVVFAVPGAFTPTCNALHVPNFLGALDALKARGVDTVACISVNDAFVLNAWAKSTAADGKILFLADWNAGFTKAAGLEFDASGNGLGTRSKRFSMVVEDGVVKVLNIEEIPKVVDLSSAEKILEAL
ncbi:glutathione amide-dependent peroxidase [bacterium BMS3Bbin10]|nr:glutathione amide-dependent peroxidase [bacterium BMS3Bbin10]